MKVTVYAAIKDTDGNSGWLSWPAELEMDSLSTSDGFLISKEITNMVVDCMPDIDRDVPAMHS